MDKTQIQSRRNASQNSLALKQPNEIGFDTQVREYGPKTFNIEIPVGLIQGYVSFETNDTTGTVVKINLLQSGYAKN